MVLPGTFGPGVECLLFKDGGSDGPYDCGAEGFAMPPSSVVYRDGHCTVWQDGSCGQQSGVSFGDGPKGCSEVWRGSKWGSIKCHDA